MIRQVFVTLLAAGALLALPVRAQTAPNGPHYGVIDDSYRSDRDAEERRDAAREQARRDDERGGNNGYDSDRDGRHGRDHDVTVVRCESIDNRRSYCPTGHVRAIRLANRLSQASCIQNRSWGRNGRGIWVDRGCRADFRVIR